MKKLAKGKPLDELVKGSLDYTMNLIRSAFRAQFAEPYESSSWRYVEEIFADYLIVSASGLKPDEYYRVNYTRSGEKFTFTPRDEWEVVELAYRPQSSLAEGKTRGQRLVESAGDVELLEAIDGQPRKIRAIGITADVINGNGRRYPASVLETAVEELRAHLHESAGQGRAVQLLGEAEHPSAKGGRASILETVVKWEAASFDGAQVLLEGTILPTSKGRDIQALIEGGVQIPISQRAYGSSKTVKVGGRTVEEVTELHITGYDLVVEASDPVAAIIESKQDKEFEMDPLNLEELRKQYPQLVAQIEAEHDAREKAKLEEALQRQAKDDQIVAKRVADEQKALREALGLKDTDDLMEALKAREQARIKLEEQERARAVADYITEQTKDLKYAQVLKDQLVAAIKDAAPKTIEEAKAVIVAKRKEYDGIQAGLELAARGFRGGAQILGPVLESETGTPEYARAAFELTEAIRKSTLAERRDFRKPRNRNEEFAAMYLERFDKVYRSQLLAESKLFDETETTADLNLPYSVSRAIVAEVMPTLVSTSIFDFGVIDTSPTRVYYEAFAGDVGYTVTVTDENVVSDEDDWVQMAFRRITPGSVRVEPNGGGVPFTEGTDYVVDYVEGRLWTIAAGDGGTIGNATALDVDYVYTAIRGGEMAAIERGETRLSFITADARADRLGTDISREAIVFSRSQLGWDAVSRTLLSLINQIRRKIDEGMIFQGLSASLIIPANSGGTWVAAADPISEFVEKVGAARVLVGNRFYTPTFLLLSLTNADRIANWDGFTAAGSRPDGMLNPQGYLGRLKGLDCFQSTEMSDAYGLIGNRELVMHRVFQPMAIQGPFPIYDIVGGTTKLMAGEQYYAEEFNLTVAPVPQKGSIVRIS